MEREKQQWIHAKEVEEAKHGLQVQKHRMEAAEKVLANPDVSAEVMQKVNEYLMNLFQF